MNIKLTPQQGNALYTLFNHMVLTQKPNGLDERLVMLLMIGIYKKFRNKWEGEPRKKYALKLSSAEAIAYRVYWRDNDLSHLPYEWAMVLEHCTQIDREVNDQITHTHNLYKFLNQ